MNDKVDKNYIEGHIPDDDNENIEADITQDDGSNKDIFGYVRLLLQGWF